MCVLLELSKKSKKKDPFVPILVVGGCLFVKGLSLEVVLPHEYERLFLFR
jgi:hypothetical protein